MDFVKLSELSAATFIPKNVLNTILEELDTSNIVNIEPHAITVCDFLRTTDVVREPETVIKYFKLFDTIKNREAKEKLITNFGGYRAFISTLASTKLSENEAYDAAQIIAESGLDSVVIVSSNTYLIDLLQLVNIRLDIIN